jgi:hypothetical protein
VAAKYGTKVEIFSVDKNDEDSDGRRNDTMINAA